MKRILSYMPALALAACASSAYGAAQCPANPLLALSGRWTFNAQATAGGADFAIAGQFTATLDPPRPGLQTPASTGWLTITASSWINGSPTRLEGDVGRYQLNSDCSGGSLIMNLSSFPMQYDFFFYNGNQNMYLISTINGRPAVGKAQLGATACPVGTAPVNVLAGPYAFRFQGLRWIPQAFGIAGVFTASTDPLFRPSFLDPRGRLDIRATSNLTFGGSVTRLEGDVGSYSILPDCTGGTLVMNLSSQPMQYDFWFYANFNGGDVIATSGTTFFTPAYGSFNR